MSTQEKVSSKLAAFSGPVAASIGGDAFELPLDKLKLAVAATDNNNNVTPIQIDYTSNDNNNNSQRSLLLAHCRTRQQQQKQKQSTSTMHTYELAKGEFTIDNDGGDEWQRGVDALACRVATRLGFSHSLQTTTAGHIACRLEKMFVSQPLCDADEPQQPPVAHNCACSPQRQHVLASLFIELPSTQPVISLLAVHSDNEGDDDNNTPSVLVHELSSSNSATTSVRFAACRRHVRHELLAARIDASAASPPPRIVLVYAVCRVPSLDSRAIMLTQAYAEDEVKKAGTAALTHPVDRQLVAKSVAANSGCCTFVARVELMVEKRTRRRQGLQEGEEEIRREAVVRRVYGKHGGLLFTSNAETATCSGSSKRLLATFAHVSRCQADDDDDGASFDWLGDEAAWSDKTRQVSTTHYHHRQRSEVEVEVEEERRDIEVRSRFFLFMWPECDQLAMALWLSAALAVDLLVVGLRARRDHCRSKELPIMCDYKLWSQAHMVVDLLAHDNRTDGGIGIGHNKQRVSRNAMRRLMSALIDVHCAELVCALLDKLSSLDGLVPEAISAIAAFGWPLLERSLPRLIDSRTQFLVNLTYI